MCGTVVLEHLFQHCTLGDYSEDGDCCFSDGKLMRGNWHKLHQEKLQIDEGQNPLKWGWRDMERGLGVAMESPSSEVIRAGLGKVLSNLTGKNVSNT